MKRRIAIVAGGFVAAVGLAVAPTVVQADPPKDEPGAQPNRNDLEATKAYWTPEKMAAAKPVQVDVPEGLTADKLPKVAKGKPKVIKGTSASAPQGAALDNQAEAQPWTAGGEVAKTTGKVFFEMDGEPWVCSASVVPSKNKSTISTAGHCVNDAEHTPAGTPGQPVDNLIFVPGYDGTEDPQSPEMPYGAWPAETWTAHTLWAAKRASDQDLDGDGENDAIERWNYDVGFAVLAPQGGQRIEEVVGSQSIAFNQPRGANIAAFGYPAAPPFDGQSLQFCVGDAFNDDDGITNDQGIDCDMTGGSSGGPWFQDFDEETGTGVQTSVNSLKYGDIPEMYGPYFGTAIQRLYETVQE